jgi:hypothetical protein
MRRTPLNKLQALKAGYRTFGTNPIAAVVVDRSVSGAVHLVLYASDDKHRVQEVTNYVAVATGNEDRLYEKDGQFLLKVNPGYNATDWANEVWKEALEQQGTPRTLNIEFVVTGFMVQEIEIDKDCDLTDEEIIASLRAKKCTFGTQVGDEMVRHHKADTGIGRMDVCSNVGVVKHSVIEEESGIRFAIVE